MGIPRHGSPVPLKALLETPSKQAKSVTRLSCGYLLARQPRDRFCVGPGGSQNGLETSFVLEKSSIRGEMAVEPVHPAEPIELVEPARPVEHFEPAEPMGTVAPVELVELVEPVETVEPAETAETVEPAELTESVKRAAPVEPVESVESGEPGEPGETGETAIYPWDTRLGCFPAGFCHPPSITPSISNTLADPESTFGEEQFSLRLLMR